VTELETQILVAKLVSNTWRWPNFQWPISDRNFGGSL